MVGELAARYVTVKYTDVLQYNQGIHVPHGVCVWSGGKEGGLHPGVLFLDSVNRHFSDESGLQNSLKLRKLRC